MRDRDRMIDPRLREAQPFVPQPPETSGEQRVIAVEEILPELIDSDHDDEPRPLCPLRRGGCAAG
jgi:hypothetical protein